LPFLALQKIFLSTGVFDTFDCLAAADVVIGSESSFSEAAAAVSTNVKIMLWENQAEQDRVVLNARAVTRSGAVTSDEQMQINSVIADWFHCSAEVRQWTESAPENVAGRFYQTVSNRA